MKYEDGRGAREDEKEKIRLEDNTVSVTLILL
jgi:hypothetical protein